VACAGRSVGVKTQYFFWLHPEWWTIGLAAGAWAVMLLHAWRNSAHGLHHGVALIAEIALWMLMVAAMMLPLVTDTIRFVASASLWARRHRAIAGFVLGYFIPWLAVGVVAATIRKGNWTHTYAAPALAFLAAAWWQKSVTYRRAMSACQSTWPIAPLGWCADRDCLRFGNFIGLACIRTCWPLMFACEFAGHGLVAMIGGMVVGLIERRRSRRRRHSAALVATVAMAGYYAVLAILELGHTTAP
jgi:hypothetical protein